MSHDIYDDAMQRLAKWRTILAGWQLGTRAKGDPEGDAVRDHREGTLILRAEVTAISALLIAKKVFTAEELTRQVAEECEHYNKTLEARFPGMRAELDGMHIDPAIARETMRGWKP